MFINLWENDPEIASAIHDEIQRQETKLELIASENYVSRAVLEALGSVLTNKYAEGYPGRRYYGGCEYVDIAERLAIERLKALFNAEHANVQPHSGSQANAAVFFTAMQPGDTFLGMSLAHGGHLSHGHPLSYSGKYFNPIGYEVEPDSEMINYEKIMQLAKEHKPKLILAGASAYSRQINFEKFREIATEVGALLMVDMAHIAGLVAVGLHQNPTLYADYVTSTTHKTLRGPRGGFILSKKDYKKDINRNVFPGFQGGPLMHVIAAKAVSFKEASEPSFKIYQEQVVKNAKHLAKCLSNLGLRIVSGGTDNHLMLVDLRKLNLTGKDAEIALDEAGITVNKNAIPFDPNPPLITSGIRIGTPAITTRGMKEAQMETISEWIMHVLNNINNETIKKEIREKVAKLCDEFPVYRELLKEFEESKSVKCLEKI